MNLQTAQECITRADDGEWVAVQDGVWLLSLAEMQVEAESWDDDDPAKGIDYTISPYWLITDDGADPVSIVTAQDLAEFIV